MNNNIYHLQNPIDNQNIYPKNDVLNAIINNPTHQSVINSNYNLNLNLKIPPGSRYFIIKSIDEDNIHKVFYIFNKNRV